MGDYVRIFSKEESYMVNKTMKSLLHNLPENVFCQSSPLLYRQHPSHIDNIEDNSIVIGRDVIPISERYKSGFMEHLNLL